MCIVKMYMYMYVPVCGTTVDETGRDILKNCGISVVLGRHSCLLCVCVCVSLSSSLAHFLLCTPTCISLSLLLTPSSHLSFVPPSSFLPSCIHVEVTMSAEHHCGQFAASTI